MNHHHIQPFLAILVDTAESARKTKPAGMIAGNTAEKFGNSAEKFGNTAEKNRNTAERAGSTAALAGSTTERIGTDIVALVFDRSAKGDFH